MPLSMSIQPTLSDRRFTMGERWWATLGFLHQLPIGSAFSQDNKEFAAHDGYIFGDEHEKYYVRLRIGFNF